MTLLRTVRLLTMLLVVVASLPMLGSEEIPVLIWWVTGAGLVAGWFVGGRPQSKQFNTLVTVALIGAFFIMLFMSLQSGEWLVNSILFALLATVTRTLQLYTARQQFQLIALSFLLMVAAAVTNPDLSFAAYFLVYTILLTWALTYAHLQQRVEEGGERSGLGWKASRLVTRRFLLGSSALALALLVSSMLIFVLFPRLGLGFFSAQTRRGNPITGFSDSLELGHFGTLEDSSRIVMRLEFPGPKEERPSIAGLKLRGVSFESYDGRAWSRRPSRAEALAKGADDFFEVRHNPRLRKDRYHPFEVDIYLEPLDVDNKVLFAPVVPLGVRHLATRFDRFRGTGKSFHQDSLGNLTFTGPAMTSTSYTARAGELAIPPARLRASGRDYPESISDLYLQLPDGLDPRVAELAGSAAGDADNPYDEALRIEDRLQNGYGYTLEGSGEQEDPISEFLFERKEGHCEYFATAMVLLLRTRGIPSRPVNGFLGATHNAFGDYYAVTESRAHSWVEVYFDGYGWVTFDPTPAVERVSPSQGFFEMLELWVDALKLRWYKWVVEYDLEKQLAVYSQVWNVFASRQNEINLSPNLSISEMKREMKKLGRGLRSVRTLAILGGLLALGWAVSLLRHLLKRRRRRTRTALDRLAARLRKVLRGKGFSVLPGTTLPALVREGVRREFGGISALARLVVALEEARWSESGEAALPPLRTLLRQVASAPKLK